MNGKSEAESGKMAPVKVEVEDSLEEEHGSFHKRPKQQQSPGIGGFSVRDSQYNPLDEPSPLGLRLRKSPSLLELIQMKLSQPSAPNVVSRGHGKKEQKGGASSGSSDKLKASNFPASVLRIGTWEYKSRYEGDLVAKCYFAKHKLVWEVLDGGLKNKIEIQWSDIMALKANYPDDGPGTLDVVLARQPLFFRETNPQPRKHTLWQATSDFTGGQASIQRRHYLECPQGLLGKHFEKLIQCDPRLNFLSQQGEITLDSPHFEPTISLFDDPSEKDTFDLSREDSPSFFNSWDAASPSVAQSSSSTFEQDAPGRHSESYALETPSPSSVRDSLTIEDIKNGGTEQLKVLSNFVMPGLKHTMSMSEDIKNGGTEQLKALSNFVVPGLNHSMSMSDLVRHLEHRISEKKESNNPTLSSKERQSLQILDDINQCLFSDIQHMPESDEKSLMSRVNSLCCLLHKDNAIDADMHSKTTNGIQMYGVEKKDDESNNFHASTSKIKVEEFRCTAEEDELNDTSVDKQVPLISRKDSVGELLLNLPRIASLPQFLFNISEDLDNQAR
ncbi:hypothetical protein Fot_48011 [Forsythia ovata]|uniref:TRF2/HOY1 PH-like domain-containing protein n=1 Tax=Forsythia ovata TaxID=205694 RepID=A0ABD1QS17_9LAMI